MVNKTQDTVTTNQKNPENSIEVGVAITTAEKERIYQVRYQIYVDEMSKNIDNADHINKWLYDETDEWAILLYAKVGTKVVGTAKMNIGTVQDFSPEVVAFLSLNAFLNCDNENGDLKFAFTTRLMVVPDYRNSPVFYLLIAKCYELLWQNQIQFSFGICNIHLPRLYEQIGFHRYTKNFVYPNYGLQIPIVLLADNMEHFRAVRSPLYRIARKKEWLDTQKVKWFHETFTKHSRIVNSQLIQEEELWSILCNRLGRLPSDAIAILRDLTVPEAKKFIHRCSVIIPCDAGNLVTNQGDMSYSYNILISGQLKSLTVLHPVNEYTVPGQPFGANGLTAHNEHTEDIAVIEAAEILVFSGLSFQKFCYSHPEIAHKIAERIANI